MRLLSPFLLLLAALVITVSLDRTPAEADLVFVNRSDVFTLDPQRQSYLQDFRMTYALYEGLVRWDNHDFSFQPAVATEWSVSPEALVWTFTMRPDARWSNGRPVTADDFVYSWMRLLLPETAADYSNLIFCIEGAEPFWTWRNDQLAAYVADPWDAEDDDLVAAAGGVVRRLRALLAADDLPAAVAVDSGQANRVRAELAGIDEAIRITATAPEDETDHEIDYAPLRAAVDAATASAAMVAALDDPASRVAETQWMWDSTERRFHETVGIEALGPHTLQVTLDRPTAYFLDLLCFGVCYPVYRPCVEGWPAEMVPAEGWVGVTPPAWSDRRWVKLNPDSGRFEQHHQWARPGTMVGNGPYELRQWRYKRDLFLARNENYHTPDLARCDTVLAVTIDDANTRVLAYESGKLDWLSEVGAEYEPDMIAEVDAYIDRYRDLYEEKRAGGMTEDEALAALPAPEAGERRNIHTFKTFGTDFYNFNCRETLSDGRHNPFADAAVRRAFARSIDKTAIVEQVTRLGEPVATTLIPPGSIPGYESPAGLGFDIEAARADLEAAGWRRRGTRLTHEEHGDFPVIDLLWTTNTPRYKWISLELKSQWERNLGVKVELRGSDTKFYKEDLKQGKFMIARGVWYGDYGDPTTFLDLCRSSDGNNDRKFASVVVDDLLRAAGDEIDREARMDLLEACERELFGPGEAAMPMVPICHRVQVYMYEPGELRGLSAHPRLTQYIWQMETSR